MSSAISTPRSRILTTILLFVCGLSAVVSIFLGIDDNPPGVLLALFAATSFVLAFTHPWRTARQFLFLLLAAACGFVLFILLNIISDSLVKNPSAPAALRNIIQSPVNDTLSLIFSMLLTALFFIGAAGSVTMFIRNRFQKNRNNKTSAQQKEP